MAYSRRNEKALRPVIDSTPSFQPDECGMDVVQSFLIVEPINDDGVMVRLSASILLLPGVLYRGY